MYLGLQASGSRWNPGRSLPALIGALGPSDTSDPADPADDEPDAEDTGT